jgi:Acetyltransferase (GNAT) family
MTCRLLGHGEYGRLAGSTLGPVLSMLPPAAQVIVVEEGDRIIGHLAVVPLWHTDGLWIAPEHRTRGRVFRLLAQGLGRLAANLGITTVIPGSESAEMDRILDGLSAVPFPARQFTLNVQECGPCRPSS